MPLSAYPPAYVLGIDNRGWLMGLKNKVQVWFTGGPRVPSGFWKFRELPKVLFMCWSQNSGQLRYENTDGTKIKTQTMLIVEAPNFYLSRIQPWTRWHFALMWPLALHWSIIWRAKDVVTYPTYKSDFGITKGFMGYLGWIRDSDRIYKPKCFLGGNFE